MLDRDLFIQSKRNKQSERTNKNTYRIWNTWIGVVYVALLGIDDSIWILGKKWMGDNIVLWCFLWPRRWWLHSQRARITENNELYGCTLNTADTADIW